ncbi:hypothetical protein QNH18_02245 [Bacillus paralicheniformis]|uniref:hypothetical protein n=1 Tax=Bacillus paralicheniformis TaxID=1648923 RepID=UPI00214CDA73|nr:hypothetical protein [Bacillus paralicheniformis]WHX87179.1 hypothetical protein QNH18_02245 [Bacillus paralicheniformis]
MLKLKDTILYKDLPTNIQSHLTAPISRERKWGMACFIVMMLDILSILPVLVNKADFFIFAAVPVAILINIWMIIMNTKSMTGYHHHLQYVRFMGVSFSGTSYCQLITAQKMMVSAIGFHVPLISLHYSFMPPLFSSSFGIIWLFSLILKKAKGRQQLRQGCSWQLFRQAVL